MDICYYDDDHLVSISGFVDSFSGRSLFKSIIARLINGSTFVKVHASHPYSVSGASIQLAVALQREHRLLRTFDRLGDVAMSFDYESGLNDDKAIELLTEVWFEYERPVMLFIRNPMFNTEISLRLLWSEITSKNLAFVIFKSAEDDVLWMGKNSQLCFSDVLDS